MVWANNQATDELSKIGSTRADVLARVFVQDLVAPSIKQEQEAIEEKPPTEQIVVVVLAPSSDWRQPFIRYLTTTDVLANNIERECLTFRSKHYVLIDRKLYHKNTKGELL